MVDSAEDNSQKRLRFTDRFGIQSNLEECQDKFIIRVLNQLEDTFGYLFVTDYHRTANQDRVMRHIASKLGERYQGSLTIGDYLSVEGRHDFFRLLQTLESLFEIRSSVTLQNGRQQLDSIVSRCLSMNEMDLGIKWENGIFYRVGAGLLDEELVVKSMTWLSDDQYKNVLNPFKKGLSHFLESSGDAERLSDTVTDMYEAIEALAKITTGRDRDLSANREMFVSRLNLNSYYKNMLRDYIEYANAYRHAVELGEDRETPSMSEVEAFIFMTGIFIRLVAQSLEKH